MERMQIKNFQLIPPGGKYLEKELQQINITNYIVVISFKDGCETCIGFVELEEALSFIKDNIEKQIVEEEEEEKNEV